jgi:hypothetical protein
MPVTRQHGGDARDDGRVDVVIAGVTPARYLRGVGAPCRPVEGQGVHVGADEEGPARHRPVERRQDAGAPDAFVDGETELAHSAGQCGSGPLLLERQLGMLVKRPSERDQARRQLTNVGP